MCERESERERERERERESERERERANERKRERKRQTHWKIVNDLGIKMFAMDSGGSERVRE